MVQGKINRGRHTNHPAGHHSIQTNQRSPPPSTHFLQTGCPSCRPTNSVKALKAIINNYQQLIIIINIIIFTKLYIESTAHVTSEAVIIHFFLYHGQLFKSYSTCITFAQCTSLFSSHFTAQPLIACTFLLQCYRSIQLFAVLHVTMKCTQ